MTPDYILSLSSQALLTALLIAAPMLGVGLVVGVAISLFQAVTQINESSLSFVPKIAAMVLALLAFSHWMLSKMIVLTQALFAEIPKMVQ